MIQKPSRRVQLYGVSGLLILALGIIAVMALGVPTNSRFVTRPPATTTPGQQDPFVAELVKSYQFEGPDERGTVRFLDADANTVAMFTEGARTVVFTGAERVFTEPSTTSAAVKTTSWVRVAPHPFAMTDTVDPTFAAWFLAQVGSGEPDVLAATSQYLAGAPPVHNTAGVQIAGDAGFGYHHTTDERDGADFYDYLKVPWEFPDGQKVRPSSKWGRDLDCSGYIRLVYGYRFGVPLYNVNTRVDGLPRSAYAIATYAGQQVAAGISATRAPDNMAAVIRPGDLVFFALHLDKDPTLITHSGIYLGVDQDGQHRFVSARSTVDGPTFGDVGGDGVLDSGYFGKRLRRITRL